MKTDERIIKIVDQYGYDAQSRQCIEEMAELTQAINKFWRKQLKCGQISIMAAEFRNKEYENVLEEIADTQIMLEQMKVFFDCEERIEILIDEKLKRQIERINNKQKNR